MRTKDVVAFIQFSFRRNKYWSVDAIVNKSNCKTMNRNREMGKYFFFVLFFSLKFSSFRLMAFWTFVWERHVWRDSHWNMAMLIQFHANIICKCALQFIRRTNFRIRKEQNEAQNKKKPEKMKIMKEKKNYSSMERSLTVMMVWTAHGQEKKKLPNAYQKHLKSARSQRVFLYWLSTIVISSMCKKIEIILTQKNCDNCFSSLFDTNCSFILFFLNTNKCCSLCFFRLLY